MSPRLLPVLLLCLLPMAAGADGIDDPPAPQPADMRDSVQRVERETGGRVLRVEPVRRGGQETYRMKVLTPEGRVRVMQDDHRRDSRRGGPRVESMRPHDEGRENGEH